MRLHTVDAELWMVPVFMFPGQSSKHPEMLERIIAVSPALTEPIVERASSLLGRDLRAWYRPENPASFATNRDVQVGVFLVSHLHLVMLQGAVFVEVGPRTVLFDLLRRSWCKSARFATDRAAGVCALPESFKRAAPHAC